MNNYAPLIILTLTERACYVMHAEQYTRWWSKNLFFIRDKANQRVLSTCFRSTYCTQRHCQPKSASALCRSQWARAKTGAYTCKQVI